MCVCVCVCGGGGGGGGGSCSLLAVVPGLVVKWDWGDGGQQMLGSYLRPQVYCAAAVGRSWGMAATCLMWFSTVHRVCCELSAASQYRWPHMSEMCPKVGCGSGSISMTHLPGFCTESQTCRGKTDGTICSTSHNIWHGLTSSQQVNNGHTGRHSPA